MSGEKPWQKISDPGIAEVASNFKEPPAGTAVLTVNPLVFQTMENGTCAPKASSVCLDFGETLMSSFEPKNLLL